MTFAAIDLEVHRFVHQLGRQLADTRNPDKVLRHALRACSEHFGAERAVIAVLEPGMAMAEALVVHPEGAACDLALVTALLRREQPPIPSGTVVARLARRGRAWGMIVLDRDGNRFPDGAPRALALVADELSAMLERLDRERLSEVRARIDGKMMRELPPKDLYYQILDGLHQLTRYDHSAALWIWNPATSELELVAEQVAFEKGKSTLIGSRAWLADDLAAVLGDGVVFGFDRDGDGWLEWTGYGVVPLAAMLDSSGLGTPPRPNEGAMLCAALGTREGPLGILKLAELHVGSFAEWERAAVERFTLLASLALQRARTIESLQARMIKVERQNALANLARGVAHDVNNALGEVLPLVQQIRSDLEAGRLEPRLLADDLDRVESSLQVTRGIFGRMLRFARGSARVSATGDVIRALESTCDLMRDGIAKQQVVLHIEAPDTLPRVRCATSDLERVFLNLMGNARDSMPGGGTLALRLRLDAGVVEIVIEDTGTGMSPETLAEIERPFYTTKEHGTGLGLSTCRSIVAEAGGELAITSSPGHGTRVTVRIPAALGDRPAGDTPTPAAGEP